VPIQKILAFFNNQFNFSLLYEEVSDMLGWSITFFVIAIIAGLLGFTGIAGAAAGIAQILFILFLILFVVFLIMGRRRPPI
jgi:uncharacterized membrane protein YtjA (UPF0391 family)